MTARNAPMFGGAGNIYIYLIYGMYYCMNIVSGKKGEGEAVLLRALEPVKGIALMRKRRNTAKIGNLCSGPGKLTQAFGITARHNNTNLFDGDIHIADNPDAAPIIERSKRIGLSQGKELELRFFIKGNSFVSGK
jgi:DNA-3-methyladenine glycosylase